MYSAKATIVAIALVAGLACVQSAGIKGVQQQAGFRAQSVKGPAALRPTFQQQQQQYAVQQPAAPVFAPQPAPQPAFFQQTNFASKAPAVQQQAAKAGPGSAAPVFNAIRVQQAPAPAPQAFQQVQQQVQVQEQEPEPQQQVQATEQEIDPSAAAQEGSAALLAPARAAAAASEEEANPRPEPYSFNYAFNAGDQTTSGSSAREEQQDASGRVTGFYTLKGEDGRDRRVDYVADASGFRATINTNELGTANKDSADAVWTAQEPSEAQLRAAESATEAARQHALHSPAQNQNQLTQQFAHQAQHQAQQDQVSFSSAASSASQKFSSPRQRVAASAGASQQFGRASQQLSRSNGGQQQQVQFAAQQLQEPFEQIRQTELQGRARKSRHAPFYLFTV